MTSNTSNSIHLSCTRFTNNWNEAQIFFIRFLFLLMSVFGTAEGNFKRRVAKISTNIETDLLKLQKMLIIVGRGQET